MKHKVLISFASSSMALSIAQLVANILVIRWVSPAELGIWHTLVVLKSYALIFNMGVSNGLNRELPFLLGKKHFRFARSAAASALYVTLLAAALSFMVFSSWAFLEDDRDVALSLFVVAVVSAVSFVNIYYGTTYRTNQAFLIFSKINVALIAIELITLVLPLVYGYQGFLIRLILVDSIKMAIFLKFQPFPVLPKFSRRSFIFLVKTGVPLFISTYIEAITETFKRVILKAASSFEMVGLFAPALAVYSLNSLLPATLGRFIFPKLNYGIGQGEALRSLWDKNLKFSIMSMGLMVPVIVIGWLAIPPSVELLFPEYTVGSSAAQVALISGLFMPFGMLMNFFHAIKSWSHIYVLVASKLVLFFAMQWIFVRIMPPLDGVAYGTLVAHAAYAALIVFFGFRHIRNISFKSNEA